MFLENADYGLGPGGIGALATRLQQPITGISKAGQDYSQHGLWSPDLPATFAGRSIGALQIITATDLLLLVLTEEPVDTQGISTMDSLRLSLTEAVSIARDYGVEDLLFLSLNETLSLAIVGVTALTTSDSLALSCTESVLISVSVATTDDLALSLTDSSAVAISVASITATDDLALSLVEATLLNVFTGTNTLDTFDSLTLALTESSVSILTLTPPTEGEAVERITFEFRAPSMRFEFL